MVVTFLRAVAAYLSLPTGVRLVSNGLAVITLYWASSDLIYTLVGRLPHNMELLSL